MLQLHVAHGFKSDEKLKRFEFNSSGLPRSQWISNLEGEDVWTKDKRHWLKHQCFSADQHAENQWVPPRLARRRWGQVWIEGSVCVYVVFTQWRCAANKISTQFYSFCDSRFPRKCTFLGRFGTMTTKLHDTFFLTIWIHGTFNRTVLITNDKCSDP